MNGYIIFFEFYLFNLIHWCDKYILQHPIVDSYYVTILRYVSVLHKIHCLIIVHYFYEQHYFEFFVKFLLNMISRSVLYRIHKTIKINEILRLCDAEPETECSICLELLDRNVVVTKCNHKFHY